MDLYSSISIVSYIEISLDIIFIYISYIVLTQKLISKHSTMISNYVSSFYEMLCMVWELGAIVAMYFSFAVGIVFVAILEAGLEMLVAGWVSLWSLVVRIQDQEGWLHLL